MSVLRLNLKTPTLSVPSQFASLRFVFRDELKVSGIDKKDFLLLSHASPVAKPIAGHTDNPAAVADQRLEKHMFVVALNLMKFAPCGRLS